METTQPATPGTAARFSPALLTLTDDPIVLALADSAEEADAYESGSIDVVRYYPDYADTVRTVADALASKVQDSLVLASTERRAVEDRLAVMLAARGATPFGTFIAVAVVDGRAL